MKSKELKPVASMSMRNVGLLAAGVIIVGVLLGYLGFKVFSNTSNTNTPATTNTNTVVNANDNSNVDVATNDNANTNVNVNVNSNTNTTTNTNTIPTQATDRKVSGTVTWNGAQETAALNILGKSSDGYDFEDGAKYYSVGTIKTGTYAGSTLVLHSYREEGPSFYPTFEWFVKKASGSLVYLKKLSGDYYQKDIFSKKKITVDTTTALTDLTYPATLTGSGTRQILTLVTGVNGLFDATNLTEVFVDPTYGSVFTNKTAPTTTPDGGVAATSITTRNGYYLEAPDGTIRVYQYKPDFMKYATTDTYQYNGIPSITWTNGTKNSTSYYYTTVAGCGSVNYAAFAPTGVTPTSGTVKVGTTSKGDAVFGLLDTNAKLLKDYYDTTYQVFDGKKVSYDTYVKDHPIFFVMDPFGRFMQFISSKYQPAAECGKPVIYLYPQSTTNVDVLLNPAGGFTKSEPAYGSGWHVTAQPNGTLTERSTGMTYPYLFWEGRGGMYQSPDQGFVVEQKNVHTFLLDSLAKLGLNAKETSDFIAFWEPRMQDSPYYVVGFYGTRVMNAIAPLTVTPKPDTIIRILMDFRPVANPVNIKPQVLTTIPRTGFTVVEWGGVLR